MTSHDPAATLRKVAALRALCLRLPHLPTPIERERLRRFEALVAAPHRARNDDVDALLAGWRRWWRDGNIHALWEMGRNLPPRLIAQERALAALWHGAELARGQGERGTSGSVW